MTTLPAGVTSYFVADTAITTESVLQIQLTSDPSDTAGGTSVQWVALSPGVGFTVYLSFPCMSDTSLSYRDISTGGIKRICKLSLAKEYEFTGEAFSVRWDTDVWDSYAMHESAGSANIIIRKSGRYRVFGQVYITSPSIGVATVSILCQSQVIGGFSGNTLNASARTMWNVLAVSDFLEKDLVTMRVTGDKGWKFKENSYLVVEEI